MQSRDLLYLIQRESQEKILDKEYTIQKEWVTYDITRTIDLNAFDNDVYTEINECFFIECSKGIMYGEMTYPMHEVFLFDKKGMKIHDMDGGDNTLYAFFQKHVYVYVVSK